MKTISVAVEIYEQFMGNDMICRSCDAFEMAEYMSTDIEQDWESESTIYSFCDGSKLKFNNDKVEVFF